MSNLKFTETDFHKKFGKEANEIAILLKKSPCRVYAISKIDGGEILKGLIKQKLEKLRKKGWY